ncbi:stress responsive alpha-beta barrel domain-containing protein [Sulfuricella denitrificans skB26]|uniref:Stress responsive alpha-beta barrel domain-containing protein n=1 Tax=Sulfuricella denitrificans (strain DSM 22764 / NBRC 105220 / skB26) TaxID=1163617 RepID=S6AZR5_SULDS|nr:Dabb family protein [Sulfuricella denitrificans]BAN34002.1 stress responsive alpha-beta barrel domain-containing protein [Sulfuricella denitrificans skB26]
MIKHIVMWRLREEAGDKTANAQELKRQLEGLNGRIPGLIKLEVGIDFSQEGESSDVVLYSEFESNAALQAYQIHPAHNEVVPFVKSVRGERRVVDYEA